MIRSAVIVLLCSISYCFGQQQPDMFRLRSELAASLPMVQQDAPAAAAPKRSAVTAVLYSLVVPGWGEYYADGFDEGRYSLAAEAALWLSYYSLRQYGGWIRDDARNYAAAHTGANIAGKDDQFFVNVGNFMNTYDYNQKKLQDRNLSLVYDANAGYDWQWDSEANRKQFRTLRVSSERVYSTSSFVIAAVVVNHVVSAINAARLTRLYNKRGETDGAWRLESSIIDHGARPDGLRLSLVRSF